MEKVLKFTPECRKHCEKYHWDTKTSYPRDPSFLNKSATLANLVGESRCVDSLFRNPEFHTEDLHHSRLGEHAAVLWKYGKITDITVKVKNRSYPAHRAVLSCYSNYFKDVLLDGLSHDSIVEVPFQSVTTDAFETLLKYMYTAKLNLTCQNIGEVYTSARKLGMDEVLRMCTDILSGTSRNDVHSVYVYVTAKKLGLTEAADRAFRTMTRRFEQIVGTQEFLDLDYEQVCEYLSAQELATRSEVIVYLAALKWISVRYLDREQFSVGVLTNIRFPEMTMTEILACHSPPLIPGVTEMTGIRDMLLKATCYIAAKTINEEKRFETYSCKPRTYLLPREPIILWDPSIFDPDRHTQYAEQLAATSIQSALRGFKERKSFQHRLSAEDNAARTIQSNFRKYWARKHSTDPRYSAIGGSTPTLDALRGTKPPKGSKGFQFFGRKSSSLQKPLYGEDWKRGSAEDMSRRASSFSSFSDDNGNKLYKGKTSRIAKNLKNAMANLNPDDAENKTDDSYTKPTESRSSEWPQESVSTDESLEAPKLSTDTDDVASPRTSELPPGSGVTEVFPKTPMQSTDSPQGSSVVDNTVDETPLGDPMIQPELSKTHPPNEEEDPKRESFITIDYPIRRSTTLSGRDVIHRIYVDPSTRSDSFLLTLARGGRYKSGPKVAPLPKFKRWNSTAIVLVGGLDSSRIEDEHAAKEMYLYIPALDEWSHLGHATRPRHHHCMVYSNRHLYCIGGCDPAVTKESKMVPLDTCDDYDMMSKTWKQMPNMLKCRMYHGVAALNGKIYAVGGKDENDQMLSSVEVYDPDEGTWTELEASLSTPTMSIGACSHNGKVWISGGMVQDLEGKLCVIKEVQMYDPVEGRWSKDVSQLPYPRCFATMVECGRKVYVIGGTTYRDHDERPTLSSMADVHYYDDLADEWVVDTPLPDPRHFVGAAAVGEAVFVLGGLTTNEGAAIDQVIAHDETMGAWRHCASLPGSVCGFGVVSVPRVP